jgi:hypothetical protein
VILAIVFLFLLTFTGCKTLEQKCIERFPITTTTEVRTQVVTDTLILPDTFVEYIDTTLCPPGLTDTLVVIKTRTRTLPGDTIYTETICTDTVTINADEEKVRYLIGDNSKLRVQLADSKRNQRNTLWTVGIIAGVLILALAGFLVLRSKKLF